MLPEGFIASLEASVGAQVASRWREAFTQAPGVSVRLNPFKTPSEPPFAAATAVPWSPYGRILQDRPVFTLDPLLHAGAYYVQDSSAMFPVHLLRQTLAQTPMPEGIRVLDLCAAPGGKSTDLAASLRERYQDRFLLVANEVMRPRAAVLQENLTLWGEPNVLVSAADPRAFGALEGYFDVIVADVPCSGEGMFRKDAQAVADWSPALAGSCAARQRRILSDVWPALREGGILVYSTCTYSREENDGMLAFLTGTLGAEVLSPVEASDGVLKTESGYLLVSGLVPGEGQYAAVVRKCSGAPRSLQGESALAFLRPARPGRRQGTWKGRDYVPDPDEGLSLGYARGSFPEWEADTPTALHYLHRDTLNLPDAPCGYLLLTYKGLPLGFVKNVGSRCNNLLPQGRRIRMDINAVL